MRVPHVPVRLLILVSPNCYYFVGIFLYLYLFKMTALIYYNRDLISVTNSYIHINIWLFAICLNCNKHFIEPNIIVAIF